MRRDRAMARREVVLLEDDLSGGDAAETVRFAIDGTFYEIDLNSKNAKKLRESLPTYVAAGRRVGRGGVAARPARGRGAATGDREQNKAVRARAKEAGKKVSDRGRRPQ